MSRLLGPIDTVVVRVRDLATARAWYEERLGLAASFESPGLVVLDPGGETTLTLFEDRAPADPASTACFPVFRTDDVDAARDALAGRGVEVKRIQEDGTARWFGFADPEGNRLEACQIVAAGWA